MFLMHLDKEKSEYSINDTGNYLKLSVLRCYQKRKITRFLVLIHIFKAYKVIKC